MGPMGRGKSKVLDLGFSAWGNLPWLRLHESSAISVDSHVLGV